jgi:hypothetical protein
LFACSAVDLNIYTDIFNIAHFGKLEEEEDFYDDIRMCSMASFEGKLPLVIERISF